MTTWYRLESLLREIASKVLDQSVFEHIADELDSIFTNRKGLSPKDQAQKLIDLLEKRI